MQYFSIDIETSSLIPEEGVILQLGAILEDTDKPLSFEESKKFEVIIKHPVYLGQPFPINMHAGIWKILAEHHTLKDAKQMHFESDNNIVDVLDVSEKFSYWLHETTGQLGKKATFNFAGKNLGLFDIPWCEKKLPFWKENIRVSSRLLDPAILYWNPIKDKRLPSMEECKKRACFTTTTIAHTTLADAWDVIQLLRVKFPQRLEL